MKRQQGITLSGFLLIAFALVVVAVFGMKLIPSYMEYLSIQKTFRAVAGNPELKSATNREIQNAWSRYAAVENINSVSPGDLDIQRDAGQIIISASYSIKIPLAGNVSACLEFNPASARK